MLTTFARHGLIVAGLLASALSAGFFYTYAVSVMPGLAAADPSSAIRAARHQRGPAPHDAGRTYFPGSRLPTGTTSGPVSPGTMTRAVGA